MCRGRIRFSNLDENFREEGNQVILLCDVVHVMDLFQHEWHLRRKIMSSILRTTGEACLGPACGVSARMTNPETGRSDVRLNGKRVFL